MGRVPRKVFPSGVAVVDFGAMNDDQFSEWVDRVWEHEQEMAAGKSVEQMEVELGIPRQPASGDEEMRRIVWERALKDWKDGNVPNPMTEYRLEYEKVLLRELERGMDKEMDKGYLRTSTSRRG